VVALDSAVDHLANDLAVCLSDHESVFCTVVLGLVLGDETLTGIVISLTLSASAELDLVPLEVGIVFDDLNETHTYY